MAKISSKKLIEKLHEIGGCDAEPDTWANGWDLAIDKAIEIVSDMAKAAERKKEAKKLKPKSDGIEGLYNTAVWVLSDKGKSCSECACYITDEWEIFFKDLKGLTNVKSCPRCHRKMLGTYEKGIGVKLWK